MNTQSKKMTFGERLTVACDENPSVPPLYKGRLTWLQDRLVEEGHELVLQSIRRWFDDSARPRHKYVEALAKILMVDLAWLATGKSDLPDTTERRKMVLASSGAVNAVIGLLQMSGYSIALPADDDTSAKREGINLYTIVDGVKYSLHVASIGLTGDKYSVAFPTPAVGSTVLIGVYVDEDMDCYSGVFPAEVVQSIGVNRQNYWVVSLPNLDGMPSLGEFIRKSKR